MGWIGKFIGGTIGLGLGGPIGGILGAALGHKFDKKDEVYLKGIGGRSSEFTSYSFDADNTQQKKEITFFLAAFSMLAKLSKVDGKISNAEIKAVEDFMDKDLKLDASSRVAAINIFRTAKYSSDSFESFARQFYEAFYMDKQILEVMIDVLLRVAASDGNVTPKEEILINSAADMFGFSKTEYENLKSKYVKSVASKYYAVLNSDPSDDDVSIKKQYRKLVQEYHPDKIISKGLPDEFVELANEKFKEIQEAYDAVSKERGM